ncbi:MAG TPA: glutamate--tRNA ligase family protein [Pyrinomonadaceae bacterium]|nr:glutamate--tRNA ligase family protein [Pyrinomonadaceae bacterium]
MKVNDKLTSRRAAAARAGYRGRLAPSPTGHLHLGHARTFRVAFERARSRGGTLVLRDEDLDPRRSRAASSTLARARVVIWRAPPPRRTKAGTTRKTSRSTPALAARKPVRALREGVEMKGRRPSLE